MSQREKGYEAAMVTQLRTAQTAEEVFAVDNGGYYTPSQADLEANGFVASPDVSLSIVSADASYCLGASTPGTDRVMYVDSRDSVISTTPCD